MSYQSSTLGIMSSETFKNRTMATKAICGRVARFKGRGNNMSSIDAALLQWEQRCNSANAFDKTAMLLIIERECEGWLGRKRGKSSSLSLSRTTTIRQLKIDAKKAASYTRNIYYSQQKHRVPTKSLDAPYQNERQHYEHLGKAANPNAAGDIDQFRHGNTIDTISFQEFRDADCAKVFYFNRAERMEYLTIIEGGRFFFDGEMLNTKLQDIWGQITVESIMYAVDKYGNLYTRPNAANQDTFFNHSSFCSGREVICAGTCAFYQGKLLYISTNSGHYKPAPPQLQQLLHSFASEQVELQNVCVMVKDAVGQRLLQAQTFLNNVRAISDWPDIVQTAAGDLPEFLRGPQRFVVSEPSG